MEEFEITFLDIDVSKLESKLLEIGAEKVGEFNFKRALFDYPDFRLDKKNSWVRLRTDGANTTLAYKEQATKTKESAKEIEIMVDDYQKTYDLLKSIGFVIKREEENKRIKYKLGATVFDIDSWPFIPTYLEVESTSIQEARNAAEKVGFNPDDGLILGPKEVYKKYGINIEEYSSITFKAMVKK